MPTNPRGPSCEFLKNWICDQYLQENTSCCFCSSWIKWWSGAGVGVGMLRGAEDSLTGDFLGFLVYGLLVSWFWIFLASKFQGFKDLSSFHFMLFERYWSHIQDFQEFIRRCVGMIWRPPFLTSTQISISNILRFINIVVQNMFPDSSWFVQVSWGLQRLGIDIKSGFANFPHFSRSGKSVYFAQLR